jgi:hypothetical protein
LQECIKIELYSDNDKAPAIRRLYLFGREDRIRTCDPLVPNQVRYRPALLPGRRRNVAAKWWAKVGVLVGIAARDWETVLEGAKDWMGKQPVGRGNR